MSTCSPSAGARAVCAIWDPTAALLLLHPFAGRGWWAGALIMAIQAVLLVALVIAYRRRGRIQRALDGRLRFERVISDVSSDFVHAPSARIDAELDRWLVGILGPFGLDRAEVRLFAEPDTRPNQLCHDLLFCASEIRQGRVVGVSSLDHLPAEATVDRRALKAAGVQSLLAVPLSVSGRTLGFLAVFMMRSERTWTEELVQGVQLVGEVFAGAIARRDAEASIQSSDAMSTAVLSSLAARVAVLDRRGSILQVNRAWVESDGELPPAGGNYLGFLRATPGPVSAGMYRAVEQVLSGDGTEDQRFEYCISASRWRPLA